MDKTFDEVFREAGLGKEEVEKLDTKNRIEIVKRGKGTYMHVYRNNRLVEVTRVK